MSSQPLLIVGSMAFDDLDLPSGSARDVVGGSCTYAAYAASLFCPVRIVGVVGQDFPELTLADLEKHGVDTSGVERAAGKTFGGRDNPLLVSVRSGSAMSMPGMMDTILNLGLNETSLKGLIKQTSNERFA